MIAISKTLKIINTQPGQPPDYLAYIFTICLNVLFLLNTEIKHPALHINHPVQVTLAFMVQLAQNH